MVRELGSDDDRMKSLPWVALDGGRPVVRLGNSSFAKDLLQLGEVGVGPHDCGSTSVMVELTIDAAEKVSKMKVWVDGDWIYSGNPGNAVNFATAAEKMGAEYAIVTVPLGDDGKIPSGPLVGVKIEFHQPERRVRELPSTRVVFVLDVDGYPCVMVRGYMMKPLSQMLKRASGFLPFCPTFENGATVMAVCTDPNSARTVWEITPFPGTHIYIADPRVAPTHECASVRYVRSRVGEDVMWSLESTGLTPTPIAATPASATT